MPPINVLDRRRAGVLLHATSLPDAERGALGAPARRFVDWLAAGGFSVWQLLPLGPVGADGSPYYALSNHAGNAALVDRSGLAGHAAEVRAAAAAFARDEAGWLADYALFTAVRDREQGRPWWDWPAPLRDRVPDALDRARGELAAAIAAVELDQYLFHSQWRALREYARERGVRLFGDVPIYVAPDSVEVWAHRGLFQLDAAGRPTAVAGVPPDYFSKDGQLWGNPLYRWEEHERTGFAWWLDRLAGQAALYDLVRIDHFRGLEGYWAVPAGARTAAAGEWRPAPGRRLLARAAEALPVLGLVAEDLGVITPEVERLRDEFALPGMRVLQFGFDGADRNVHVPYAWIAGAVGYTGTHDNDTTRGWFDGLGPGDAARVLEYLATTAPEVVEACVRCVLASPAALAVVPMQDLLGLGSGARMNTPATTAGNWSWRLDWEAVPGDLAARCRRRNALYGRA